MQVLEGEERKKFEHRLLASGLYVKYREDLLMYGHAAFLEKRDGSLERVQHLVDVKLGKQGLYVLREESQTPERV